MKKLEIKYLLHILKKYYSIIIKFNFMVKIKIQLLKNFHTILS